MLVPDMVAYGLATWRYSADDADSVEETNVSILVNCRWASRPVLGFIDENELSAPTICYGDDILRRCGTQLAYYCRKVKRVGEPGNSREIVCHDDNDALLMSQSDRSTENVQSACTSEQLNESCCNE